MPVLYDGLFKYSEKRISSFHTPGHSGNANFIKKLLDLKLDLTELPDTASLYDGGDLIEESEKRMAEIFSARKTLYSAGGCTLAIDAMLRLCAFPEGKVIAGRNIHKSAVNAMALLGLSPVWIYPDNSGGDFFTGRIDEKSVEKALSENSNVCAVYITTPDYFGVISPLHKISEVTKKYNVPLIVDNAHGSHLVFFPKMHPLSRGADMSACSLHKTLPVLTGGAALNIANKSFCDGAKQAMADFGSTSPSFLTLSSIDLCLDYMKTRGKEDYIKLSETVKELKKTAEKCGFKMPLGECDPVRLTLNTASLGVRSDEAYKYFREKMIEPEMSDGKRTVFILTPFNTDTDIERLFDAIRNFPLGNTPYVKEEAHKPCAAMPLREAFISESVRIKTACAVGRIAAKSVCSCPPGVPPVIAGEIIDDFTAEILIRYGFEYINVVK